MQKQKNHLIFKILEDVLVEILCRLFPTTKERKDLDTKTFVLEKVMHLLDNIKSYSLNNILTKALLKAYRRIHVILISY
jgi:hypothetical protein